MSSILVLFSLSFVSYAQDTPRSTAKPDGPVPQQLRISSQPDAPLRIVSADVTWALPDDRRGVQIYIMVENVSQRTVRTYATRRDVDATTGPKACLGPPVLPGRFLRPGQKAGTSTWQGAPNSDRAPAAWIDFVEFADGTTWGADECQMAEALDGSRTGARMQTDQLLGILHEKGAEALMAFIKDNFHKQTPRTTWSRGVEIPIESGERPLLPIAAPTGHSKRWEEAFTGGAGGVVEQVIDAYWKWGGDEIEHVLLRPIVPVEKK